MRGGPGPTAAFASGEPLLAAAAAAAAEEVEENSGGEDEEQEDDELELGLCLGSKKQQSPSPAPCRILTARDLQPGAMSPDSSVSSSSPAAGAAAAAASKRAKAEAAPTATASPGTVASGHPQSFGVVGWPPIRTFRMNSLFNQGKDNASEAGTKKAADESDVQKDKDSEKKGRLVGWVKVNMDGDVIGRKVDLNAHRSYKTLASALELMFMKPSIDLCTSISGSAKSLKLLDNSSEYQLTYEDRDGDWMLVGDVPWEMFVSSVKRLRIMRTSDANGLGPRFQGVHRTAASTRGRS
ncbi:auxin-responsive protein IAA10 isoform X2 [Phragmites australis]|uniref:auxin-responsive protein IAA10 isoform X2 n=1 Tax=Phragmites australis TaxID=29695 RepID=UPI002D78E9E9|nr:auxin-responsive protein IAA10 isoform X2 [Phragmites australis]